MRATDPPNGRPFRRRVFYIPGYDPSPARSYRERYRREAARQASISGHEISVAAAGGAAGYGWNVRARIEGQAADTHVEVLEWSDLVRASMTQGIGSSYLSLVHTAWIYIVSGALFRLMRLRKGPVIAALYPVLVLTGEVVIALAGGVLALMLILWLFPSTAWAYAVAALGALGSVASILALLSRQDRFLARYLMQDYAYSAGLWGRYPEAQSQRIDAFADRVEAALVDRPDEVLIVGHSSGAYLAVSVLARLIRRGRPAQDETALSLLTLGQVIPMVSVLPKADDLRADMRLVSTSTALTWVDVSAPGDGCSFALCDPVSVSGMAGPGKRWPLILSAAFSQTLRPESVRALRWRFFERHFQYLNAFDALPDDPGAYDYFAITAGARSLWARMSRRKPSASRIESAILSERDHAA